MGHLKAHGLSWALAHTGPAASPPSSTGAVLCCVGIFTPAVIVKWMACKYDTCADVEWVMVLHLHTLELLEIYHTLQFCHKISLATNPLPSVEKLCNGPIMYRKHMRTRDARETSFHLRWSERLTIYAVKQCYILAAGKESK